MDPLGEVQPQPGTEKGCGQQFLDHYLGWVGQERGAMEHNVLKMAGGVGLGAEGPFPTCSSR